MNNPKVSPKFGLLLLAMLLVSACTGNPLSNRAAGGATATPVIVPITEAKRIVAEGRLLPVQSIELSFSSGGRVQEVLVIEGGDVQAGQVIARLSGAEQLQTAIEAAEFELLAARQEIDSLNENYAQALADAQLQLVQAKIDLEDAEEDRTRMVYRRASDATLNGLRADVIMAEEELEKAQDFYDHVSGGGDNVVTAQALSGLSSAQKARDRAQYNLIYASELPDQNEIDKADANVMIAKSKIEAARIKLERLASGPDSNALALAEARQQKAETDLKARQSDLNNLDLEVPFGGKVVDLNISVGEQVGPGQSIATLADFSRWIVETTDLTEINIADVKVGQTVTLVADALPGETFTGTVERISNVYEEKQGDITYTVRIALDQADEWLRWGMTFVVQLPTSTADQPASQVQATPVPTIVAKAAVTSTAVDTVGSAEKTVLGYFEALENQDPRSAVKWLSNYSMIAEKTTREASAAALQARMVQGNRWSAVEVKESREQNDNTILVHVLYKMETKDSKTSAVAETQQDEWWPVRLENGKWLYNWNNVIDYRGLDVAAQSTGGLTINPVQITRYTDRLSLVLFVQNRTNEPIVLGQPNEILAIFTFGAEKIEAEKAQLVFDRLQTYPDARIEVKGQLPDYPDKVEIRKWKNYDVAPWYDFTLALNGK